MENRIVCSECDNDEFHVLIPDRNEFVEFKCLECGGIIKADFDDDPLKKFIIDRHIFINNN